MSLVEDYYRQAMDAMTPAQRIERMVSLIAMSRTVVAQSILAELGPLSAEELKLRVALRAYPTEPWCRQIIEEALARVSQR